MAVGMFAGAYEALMTSAQLRGDVRNFFSISAASLTFGGMWGGFIAAIPLLAGNAPPGIAQRIVLGSLAGMATSGACTATRVFLKSDLWKTISGANPVEADQQLAEATAAKKTQP